MFGKKASFCLICRENMEEVELHDVPREVKREFARLNRWYALKPYGWYYCSDCDFYVHEPTVETIRRMVK